jgi:hypothetical protein
MIRLLVSGLLAITLSGAALAAAPPAPKPPLELVSATPAKVLFAPDEPITAAVTVKNNTDGAKTVTVRAYLEWEIDARSKAQQGELKLDPGQTATAAFKFPKAAARYGHTLKAEVLVGDAVVASGEDYFNVCDNYWNVALIQAVGFIWDQWDSKLALRPETEWLDKTVAAWRHDYYNGFEKFFWAPDDFLDMTPDKDVWWSGQARYLESKKTLQTLIAKAHAQGMKAITYAKLTGGGPVGAEMARRHPEWMWQSEGVLSVDRNAQALALWDTMTTKPPFTASWVAVNYNMNDPKVVEIGIRELVASAKMFGWDGARWDGNFDVAREVRDLDGKPVETLTAEQADARNAENMRHTKQVLSKAVPGYVYGYNWTQGNWAQSMATSPKESTELCGAGGLIMNEYINQAEGVQHPLHRWDVYGSSVAADVDAIRKLGGYYGPILSSPPTADGKYTNVFAYAAGAHPYYHHLWGAFMTRYGTFCWDNALQRVPPGEAPALIEAPDTVWWKHWVFDRPIDKKHRQIIVHLINPPARPTVGEGKKPEDVPAPVRNVEVRLRAEAIKGWTVSRATRLSPEPLLKEGVPVRPEGAGGAMTVPEVALWTILVIDLGK